MSAEVSPTFLFKCWAKVCFRSNILPNNLLECSAKCLSWWNSLSRVWYLTSQASPFSCRLLGGLCCSYCASLASRVDPVHQVLQTKMLPPTKQPDCLQRSSERRPASGQARLWFRQLEHQVCSCWFLANISRNILNRVSGCLSFTKTFRKCRSSGKWNKLF